MSAVIKQRDLFTRRWRGGNVTPQKEVAMQIQLVSLLRWCLRPDVTMRHVPNGELRDKRTAAKLKAMGVLAGSADLEFFWKEEIMLHNMRHHVFRALFLELKVPGNQLTSEQAAFGTAMKLAGAEYFWTVSIDRAIELLKERGLLRPDRQIHIPTGPRGRR